MSSSATTEDDISERWFEFDDNLSGPTQTLDEILLERDNGFDEEFSIFEEDESFARLGTSSLLSTADVLPITYQLNCPILLNKFETITNQLRSVYDKPIGGKPTAIAVSPSLIAVGTIRGLTILFDRKSGRLTQFMHDKNEKCPVSALEFSPNGTKIAVAFSGGALRIHKTANGKLVDNRAEIVQPGHGILHVLYILNSVLLLVDSGGSVYEYRENRNRGARCIFTGCKGEAVNIHFVRSEKLVLLSTLKQVLVFNIGKSGVLAQLRLVGPPNAPPCIDSHVQTHRITARTSATDTRFCLARANEIRILQTQVDAKNNPICQLVRVIQLPTGYIVCSLCWLNEHYLLVMDSKEHLLLVDLHRGALVDTLSINSVQLVYGSADFKGLSTGGNVSDALRCLAENVCYQSICHHEDQVYILGQRDLYCVEIMDQISQLDLFIERNEIASAVLYAIDIYYGRIHDRSKRKNLRAEVSSRMPDLILKLLDVTIDGMESGKVSELAGHYKRHIYILTRACVVTSHFDLLYNTVYRRIESDPLAKQVFLELLEEFVSESQLYEPPPTLVRDYLEYLVGESQFSLFETAVTRIPINALDLHQVMTICRQNQLFDGIIYIMNNALADYNGPLEEMCENLSKFVAKSVFSDAEIAQGNKLLLYLNCCLAGRAYPYGQLPAELVDVVPLEAYKFMMAVRGSKTAASSNLKNDQKGAEENFPNLRLFLRYDAQQFLNVIRTCADAPLFMDSKIGRMKRFVDTLVDLAQEIDELSLFLPSFVAHLLLKSAINQDNTMVERLILRVLNESTREQQRQTTSQIEQSIIELLRAVPDMDLERILEVARRRPFILICAYIFMLRKEYINLLLCCMEDRSNSATVFEIIRDLLNGVSGRELDEIRLFVKNSMGRLNRIDSLRTAELFLEHFLEVIASAKALPFDMLKNCFSIRQKQGSRTICGDDEADEMLFRSLFEAIVNRGHADANEFRPRMPADELDLILVDLLKYWLPTGSQDDGCLNSAVKSGLLECTVLLLLARQHKSRAFKVLFDSLEHSMEKDLELASRRIQLFLDLSNKYQREAREGGWLLKLFYLLLSAKDKQLHIENYEEIFVQLLSEIIESGAGGSAGIEGVIETLFSHSSFRDAPYSSFSSLIKKMLFSCRMEEWLLRGTVECERVENLETLQRLVHTTRALHCPMIEANVCVYCRMVLKKSFYAFGCSHLSHEECATQNDRKCPCLKDPQFRLTTLPSNYEQLHEQPSNKENSRHQMYDEESLKLWPQGRERLVEPPPTPTTTTNPFD